VKESEMEKWAPVFLVLAGAVAYLSSWLFF